MQVVNKILAFSLVVMGENSIDEQEILNTKS